MSNRSNDFPIKVYKQMLVDNYKENKKDADKIKNFLSKNLDPICQKEDRYIPPKTRGNILTEKYIKKMANKPEKPRKKRIPLKSNLGSGPVVTTEERKLGGIKMNPKIRRNDISTKSYENYKHLRTYKTTQSLKNFYFDDHNSVKENQEDLARLRASVSKIFFYKFIYLAKICPHPQRRKGKLCSS